MKRYYFGENMTAMAYGKAYKTLTTNKYSEKNAWGWVWFYEYVEQLPKGLEVAYNHTSTEYSRKLDKDIEKTEHLIFFGDGVFRAVRKAELDYYVYLRNEDAETISEKIKQEEFEADKAAKLNAIESEHKQKAQAAEEAIRDEKQKQQQREFAKFCLTHTLDQVIEKKSMPIVSEIGKQRSLKQNKSVIEEIAYLEKGLIRLMEDIEYQYRFCRVKYKIFDGEPVLRFPLSEYLVGEKVLSLDGFKFGVIEKIYEASKYTDNMERYKLKDSYTLDATMLIKEGDWFAYQLETELDKLKMENK
jgi:hypothetical protein